MYSPAIFGAVPQTHRETPHKGARVGLDFRQRSDMGTCVRMTNGREILCQYHIGQTVPQTHIRQESVPHKGARIDLWQDNDRKTYFAYCDNNTWNSTLYLCSNDRTGGAHHRRFYDLISHIEMVWSALKRNLERQEGSVAQRNKRHSILRLRTMTENIHCVLPTSRKLLTTISFVGFYYRR